MFTYPKAERLKSRKLIGRLFSSGKSIGNFPLRVLYEMDNEVAETLQAGVTVSSRSFKKAVHRNRVKRILREAYRLHKAELKEQLETSGCKLFLFIIYTGKELPELEEIQLKMKQVLQKIAAQISNQKKD